jgi:hypothetical protein
MLRLRLLATTASTILAMAALIAPTASGQTTTPTTQPTTPTTAPTTTPAPAPADPARPVRPEWGDIDAFWGDIDAFWGDIDAFSGDVNPFWGDIDAFWGDIDAFWGDIDAFQGGVTPLWGDIDAFWGDIDAFGGGVAPLWGDIDAFWGDIDAFGPNDPARLQLQSNFNELVTRSAAFWGGAVSQKTGKSFWDGFAAGVFAKHGININDPSTFNGFSGIERTRFFFDWYDGLMAFSGRDHADWWMKTTNWSPSLAATLAGQTPVTIGLIDFTASDADVAANISRKSTQATKWSGYNNSSSGHGNAVANLLVAPHDGRGIMGINPWADLAVFNPFDATGTASWADVENGLESVLKQRASVVNLSLGVPGWTLAPEWRTVYNSNKVSKGLGGTIFVHAAGNSGLAQTQNIEWDFNSNPTVLVVGSVGPSGQISSFSNTPGQACLLDQGSCLQANRLMNRFLVAPGEWILVDDGKGGVTRRSGTSFAAPMVTGAISLLQQRWGWLKQKPRETADIILRSATDLGAPGVDPVYGRGLLNIAASQAPLNYSNLYQQVQGAKKNQVTKSYITLANPGTAGMLLSTSGASVTAFEDIGTTYRDFKVPLSAILQPSATLSTTSTSTLTTAVATSSPPTNLRFADARVANPLGWDLRMTIAELPPSEQGQRDRLPFAPQFSVTSRSGVTMNFGDGLGAQALSGNAGAAASRFETQTGGVNPVLGLASGGSYANLDVPVLGSARLSFGATSRRVENLMFDPASGEEMRLNDKVAPYQASAAHMLLTQPVGEQLSLSAGYTYLQESDGLLGVQSTNPLAFAAGSRTDAATLGLTWELSDRVTFSGSATLGRTRGQSAGEQMLAVHGDGIITSAFEAAFDIEDVFGSGDRARFALVQPMHVEHGGLNLTNYEVVDRETGELGSVTSFNAVDGLARKLALDVSYGAPVFGGQGEVAGFVRAEAATAAGLRGDVVHMLGGRFSLGF